MSQKAGVGLSSEVDGVPIEFIVGASGTMKLKVCETFRHEIRLKYLK